jgi:hypothetical protein
MHPHYVESHAFVNDDAQSHHSYSTLDSTAASQGMSSYTTGSDDSMGGYASAYGHHQSPYTLQQSQYQTHAEALNYAQPASTTTIAQHSHIQTPRTISSWSPNTVPTINFTTSNNDTYFAYPPTQYHSHDTRTIAYERLEVADLDHSARSPSTDDDRCNSSDQLTSGYVNPNIGRLIHNRFGLDIMPIT